MPPIIALGSPWPPGTAGGGGTGPGGGGGFGLGVSGAIVPGSQAPMSSMPALWLAPRPAEEPAPTCAAVVRKPVWNGLILRNASRSLPAFVQHGSVNLRLVAAAFIVAWLHSRRAKL